MARQSPRVFYNSVFSSCIIWRGPRVFFHSLIPPYPDLLVCTTAAHLIAIRAPVQCKDLVFVARKILLQFCGPHVPDLQCCVFTTTCKQPAVCREAGHVHRTNVRSQGVEELSIPS